jgi:uncharacterized membrane protein
MESRVKLFGHSVHQQLIVFPLGLLATAVIFDLLTWATGVYRWRAAAYPMIGAGVLTGALAAIFGLMDWTRVPRRTRARRIGALHGLGNAVVLILFGASFVLRSDNPTEPPAPAQLCSYCGGALALLTGWLGGELVSRLGVGVDDQAGLNAPNSLIGSGRSGGTEQARPL